MSSSMNDYESIGGSASDAESGGLLPRRAPQQPQADKFAPTPRNLLALMGLCALIGLVVMMNTGDMASTDVSSSASGALSTELFALDGAAYNDSSSSEEGALTPSASQRLAALVTAHTIDFKEKDKDGKRKQQRMEEKAAKTFTSDVLKEPKRKKKKSARRSDGGGRKENVCEDPDYTKVTLKTATESPMVGLFAELHGEKKFEASDVIQLNGNYIVVFDNLYYLGLVEHTLAFHGRKNHLVHSNPRRDGDSGFEAFMFIPSWNHFVVFVESERKNTEPFVRAAMSDDEELAPEGDKTPEEAAASTEGKHENKKHDGETEAISPQYHAIIEEVDMPFLLAKNQKKKGEGEDKPHKEYTVLDRCAAEFTFNFDNKGFEGAVHVVHNDQVVLLALCEGNFCEGGKRGREVGNGRLVLMVKQDATATTPCMWKTVNLLALPPTAAFEDFSAVAIRRVTPPNKHASAHEEDEETRRARDEQREAAGEKRVGEDDDEDEGEDGDEGHSHSSKASRSHAHSGSRASQPAPSAGTQYHLAVSSQESSQVWIGMLQLGSEPDLSDWKLTEGVVYNFPRTNECDIEYCNIEGIDFVDDNLLVAVSDKMKGGGRQHYRCLAKDQSIHTFVLP